MLWACLPESFVNVVTLLDIAKAQACRIGRVLFNNYTQPDSNVNAAGKAKAPM
jgi:hypothetical protein